MVQYLKPPYKSELTACSRSHALRTLLRFLCIEMIMLRLVLLGANVPLRGCKPRPAQIILCVLIIAVEKF